MVAQPLVKHTSKWLSLWVIIDTIRTKNTDVTLLRRSQIHAVFKHTLV